MREHFFSGVCGALHSPARASAREELLGGIGHDPADAHEARLDAGAEVAGGHVQPVLQAPHLPVRAVGSARGSCTRERDPRRPCSKPGRAEQMAQVNTPAEGAKDSEPEETGHGPTPDSFNSRIAWILSERGADRAPKSYKKKTTPPETCEREPQTSPKQP